MKPANGLNIVFPKTMVNVAFALVCFLMPVNLYGISPHGIEVEEQKDRPVDAESQLVNNSSSAQPCIRLGILF